MSRNHPKLKPPPRPFFSCAIFRNCTHSVISPKTPPTSASSFLPPPPPPPPPATPPPLSLPIPSSSSSSSSSSASHSFTQWRFPLQHPPPPPPPDTSTDLAGAFHASQLHFAAGNTAAALRLLESSLATASSSSSSSSPPAAIMKSVLAALRETETARAASKVLLAMVLSEGNRRAAVAAGAASAAVEVVDFAGAATVKERTLAALELLCTVEEGAAEVRGHAAAAAALARCVEGMKGRGRECGIGILAAIYGGERAAEAPVAVAQAVVVALQGECSARGRRKGAQLLRAMKERMGLDLGAVVGDD